MRNALLGSAFALAWCVAVAFAQQQPAPVPPAPAHKVFVLTGCLTEETAAFKLTDASPIGQAPPGAVEPGAVGTSGQKGLYVLHPVSGLNAQGKDAETLKAHVGQRVEVVVRPVDAPAPAPPAANLEAQAPKPEAAPPRYAVTEIKRVLGSCL